MTKRSRRICTILAIIFAVLLEVATLRVMKYDAFSMIVSTVLYFATFLFAVIDAYCTFKNGFNKFHFFMTIKSLGILGVQLTLYYFLGNMKAMKASGIIIAAAVLISLLYIVIKFGKLAKKNCPYKYPE